MTTQYTFARRFDLLSTAQLWNIGEGGHFRLGAALMRKTTAVDLTTELYFDSADDRLHPGVWIEGHRCPGCGPRFPWAPIPVPPAARPGFG